MRFLRRATAGAKAGVLAGAGVAILLLIEDAFQLRPLSTPAGLAEGLLGEGAADVGGGLFASLASVGILGAWIVTYTLLHLLVFACVGVIGAFVLEARSFWTALLGGAAYGSVVCTGLLYGARWVVESPVALDALGLPSVLLANAMAGAILGLALHLDQLDPEVDASG